MAWVLVYSFCIVNPFLKYYLYYFVKELLKATECNDFFTAIATIIIYERKEDFKLP